jgi:hypothetical protein
VNMKKILFGVVVVALGLCSLPALAAQGQTGAPPTAAQQGVGEYPPDAGAYPQSAPPSSQQIAQALTLPAGTLIQVRLTDMLSSDRNRPGDGFTTVLDQPIVAQGWVVSRRGQTAVGRVAVAQNAGRVQGVSQLAVELSELVLVDGQQIPIRTQLVQSSGGTTRARDAEGVGAATGIGAVIGGAAAGGSGAAIGAAAGAVAGVVGVLTTRGRATELYPETLLTFRLEEPVTISTQQSPQAFRAITQQDYPDRGGDRNPPRNFRPVEAYPPPPYYYSPYSYYPGYGYYGSYGYGYGYGPRIYVSPRVYFGPRHFRHR